MDATQIKELCKYALELEAASFDFAHKYGISDQFSRALDVRPSDETLFEAGELLREHLAKSLQETFKTMHS